eukprot:3641196-Rhodomonas_salina.1
MVLRPRYAKSSTDVAYGATRVRDTPATMCVPLPHTPNSSTHSLTSQYSLQNSTPSSTVHHASPVLTPRVPRYQRPRMRLHERVFSHPAYVLLNWLCSMYTIFAWDVNVMAGGAKGRSDDVVLGCVCSTDSRTAFPIVSARVVCSTSLRYAGRVGRREETV